MKKILTAFIVIACTLQTANSQSDDFAQLNNKTLHLKNGIALSEGDALLIGNPTGCYENCFENIFSEPEEMVSKITHKFTKNIYANYSGEKVSIKKIKQISKKNEKIWLLTLYYRPQKENLYCYLEKALNTGEILIQTGNIITPKQIVKPETEQTEALKEQEDAEKNTVNFSIADEIRKLKALLDEGIITKEEFEKQKAKLLE
ncbi:MAG: SHOCT domain-containing protein [Prevotellaceae bacterium]|jgi:hypothetical protein|nr:SHOCT domain-containing protein [Prevotellaceae bacterium]